MQNQISNPMKDFVKNEIRFARLCLLNAACVVKVNLTVVIRDRYSRQLDGCQMKPNYGIFRLPSINILSKTLCYQLNPISAYHHNQSSVCSHTQHRNNGRLRSGSHNGYISSGRNRGELRGTQTTGTSIQCLQSLHHGRKLAMAASAKRAFPLYEDPPSACLWILRPAAVLHARST